MAKQAMLCSGTTAQVRAAVSEFSSCSPPRPTPSKSRGMPRISLLSRVFSSTLLPAVTSLQSNLVMSMLAASILA